MSGADRNSYTLCVKYAGDDNANVALRHASLDDRVGAWSERVSDAKERNNNGVSCGMGCCNTEFAESANIRETREDVGHVSQVVERSPSSSSSSSSSSPVNIDDGGYFVFDPSCIVVTDVLGKGGFGTVHRGTVGERQVAVKTFHSKSKNPDACQETYERELHVLRLGLRHENLVRMLGATCIEGWQEGPRIVMDYAGNCSLQTILDDEDTKLDMDDRVMFGVQMVRGLQYLHQHGVLHLDLKPANFMFGSDCVLRLGDFGTCHVLGTPFESHLLGTLAFRAPELFNKGDPTQAADVFSLGVTLWCLETQKMPYEGMAPMAIVYQVVQMRARPQVPAGEASDWRQQDFRDLYCRCWAGDPGARPTLDHVRSVLESLETEEEDD